MRTGRERKDPPLVFEAIHVKVRKKNGCKPRRGVGPNIRRVVSRAIYTEVNSRLQLRALALGGPITYITPEAGTKMEAGRDSNRMGSGRRQDRTWEMWKQEASSRSAAKSR